MLLSKTHVKIHIDYVEINIWTPVANGFCTYESDILVFISQVAKQLGK